MLRYLHVSKADNGEITVFDSRDKFAAGFVQGHWVLGHDFDDYALEERFKLVQNDRDCLEILMQARAALDCQLEETSENRAKSA